MTDDLPFGEPLTPPTVNVTTRRCARHTWETMRDSERGYRYPPEPVEWTECLRCGKVKDEAVARRNKRNRQRGGAFERSVAAKLGGRRTGPLGGRDDVMVGELFAIQTKRAERFSQTEARTYLDDLRRAHPGHTPLVVHAFPNERGGVVMVSLEDWVALHGEDGQR